MLLYYINANHHILPLELLFELLTREEIDTCLCLTEKHQYIQAMSYTLQRYAIFQTLKDGSNLTLKDIPITRKPGYKPYYTPGGVHYSVSHTKGHIFVIVSDNPCGIDIESQRASIPDILYREFGLKEGTVQHWTMVESCLKYYGCGLAGIHDISFDKENQLLYKNKSVRQMTVILPKDLNLNLDLYGTVTF